MSDVLTGWSAAAKGAVAPALLGPSGSGKTTVPRAIAGLEELEQREVGFIFQGYALCGWGRWA